MKKQTVELLPIDSVTPYPRNARVHSEANIAKIVASIKEFGWTVPILVDEDATVLAGHGRLLAARAINMPQVPCLRLPGLSSAQKRAYRLADNRLTLDSDWDFEALKLELADLDFDLALTGFDPEELDDILGRNIGSDTEDDVPELQETALSQCGEVWRLGRHRIFCGVCEQMSAKLFDVDCFDLVVTSPPYNQMLDGWAPSGMHAEPRHGGWVDKVRALAYEDSMPENEYQAWQKTLLDLLFGCLKDGGSLFYNHKNRYRDKHVISPLQWLPGPFAFRQEIIWSRPGSVTQNARMFLASDERIYWLYKGKNFFMNDPPEIKNWSTVWDLNPSSEGHPCAFPVEIPRRCILACTTEGQSVYDPFVGSGTTIIACESTERVGYGSEKEPRFVDVAIRRWQTFTGKEATRLENGRTFAELEAK